MPTRNKFVPSGVIPACLLPFNDDFSIDEKNYRKHLRDVAAVEGLSAVTVNAHASEAHACSFEEQQRVLGVSLSELPSMPVVNGIYADGSAYAAKLASMADAEGASALLVFPPNSIAMGGQLRPEMALSHFKMIADSTDLPLIVFQYPMGGGLGHTLETLVRMAEEIPSVVAIKDWCNDGMLHERHIRVLQNLSRPISVLTTHSAWLMSSLMMGCNGLLSGAGSVIADLQMDLWRAVQSGDLVLAQGINDRIYPMVQAFYAPPFLDMHNRMKEVAVLLERLPRAVVRPPLCKLGHREIEVLKRAIKEADIGPLGAGRRAA
ncbi:MAG: dihydrodipicolinate synthase family protein [Nisaea sp.]|nr:dihydrodipicolinate synthase family protein [Nisaea sp.]